MIHSKAFNFLGVPINLGAIGFNMNEAFGWIQINLSEIFQAVDVNLNLVTSVALFILACVWWRFKIKGETARKKKNEFECEEARLSLELKKLELEAKRDKKKK